MLKPFVYGLALDEGLIHPASCCKTSPGAPVIIDQVTLIAVSWPDQHERGAGALAELTCCQVLEAYGPKRFAAKLRNVGFRYICPTVLRRIFHSFSAALGKTGRYGGSVYRVCSPRQGRKLRLQPDDPLLERPLMSSGARGSFAGLWLMKRNPCRIVPSARRPTGMENGHQLWLS